MFVRPVGAPFRFLKGGVSFHDEMVRIDREVKQKI
jgi:hypothetical protein